MARVAFLIILFLFPATGFALSAEKTADDASLWKRFSTRVAQTWNSPTVDLYAPVYTWHNRFTYDTDKVQKYNEMPWGAGIGKSFVDEDGDWHALYYIGFQDSHDMYEPMLGYAFQNVWRYGAEGDWRLGLGFTAGLTARQQYNYIPLPLVLPVVSLEYKRAALQAAYIPGTYNNGNVLFCWLRWQVN